LEAEVQAERAAETDADRRARVEQMQLHARAVRQLMRYIRPTAPSDLEAAMPADGTS
jgi:F-type H+-transporting ATPase subunit epsilon